ncbi:hypothetical protein BMI86_05720 [Thioclava sp. DLFJ5-1]|nr:hypothetical protein BMI86_05720 [Thioclava sp. DLFJ5-1]
MPSRASPQTRLLLETRSRNTCENARFSHDLAQPKPSKTWVLITSAFHMRRAMASFKRAGWDGLPPPLPCRFSRGWVSRWHRLGSRGPSRHAGSRAQGMGWDLVLCGEREIACLRGDGSTTGFILRGERL